MTWARTDSYYGGGGNQTLCSGGFLGGTGSYYYGCSGQPGEPAYNSSFACFYGSCADQYSYYITQWVAHTGPNPHTIYGLGYAN